VCGIAGFLDLFQKGTDPREAESAVRRMMDSIRYRGPDDSGSWVDPRSGIALGFRRLAILDLSSTGHQPMLSADERYVIIFNGEIYNYSELKLELTKFGHTFRGTSDTEIMLAGFLQWGILETVRRFNGMFAIALWDRQFHTLYLIRDRLGIKPLYYGRCGNVFLFGSELKALRAHPAFKGEIDRDSLTLFLRHNYIPAPFSIYQGIYKLDPGTILSLDTRILQAEPFITSYWSARDTIDAGLRFPFAGSDDDAIDELDTRIRESIRLRMIADVPLGAFLSGGIDSSTVVSLMQAQSMMPVKTFTIGFSEFGYNEAGCAKAVANHLGTEHTELYVTPEDAQSVIPELPFIYDEPFADSSQIPTYLVSRLARQQVTVSLSGDGGDELFGGYSRYDRACQIWRSVAWIPAPIRQASGRLLAALLQGRWQESKALFPARDHLCRLKRKVRHLAEALDDGFIDGVYRGLVSHWEQPERVIVGGHEPLTLLKMPEKWPQLSDLTHHMMYLDLMMYLPDDILVKLDRASMGVSLEGRVPFLDDHRVVEFAWRLPVEMKFRKGVGKWILRQVLYRYVPKELVERPKMGFAIPIDMWLRGSLRDWAESLLDGRRLREDGIFDPVPIRAKWNEHLDGIYDWQFHLWTILMFQAWYQATNS